jgi:hypothetical protein
MVDAAAGGNPQLLREFGMRFARPSSPGDEVLWQVHSTDLAEEFATTAFVDRRAVVKEGIARIGSPSKRG